LSAQDNEAMRLLLRLGFFYPMKKDTFYFSHDYNAANDVKVLFLRQQLGMEGYGIFWYLVEQLANAGGRLPLNLTPVLAMQMHTSEAKVNVVITGFELFTIEEGYFSSVRLDNHLQLRDRLSENGKNGAKLRWGNSHPISHPNSPPIGTPNAKERKEKEIKVNEINNKETFITNIEEYREILGESYDEFVEYWCEPSKSGKLRYEMEKFFDIKRRINTWIKNKLRYGNQSKPNNQSASKQRIEQLKSWVNS
jgi:hypothetical protein